MSNSKSNAENREFRSFEEAREFARALKLKNLKEWREFAQSDRLPQDIPTAPEQAYEDKGWKGIGDWLRAEEDAQG